MAIVLTISATLGGANYADSLAGGNTGISYGSVSNGAFGPLVDQPTNDGNLPLYIRHDAAVDPITNLRVFIAQYSGTYGGADSAANDFATIKAKGFASASATANNSDGLYSGLAYDMDWQVSTANQFLPSRIFTGGGGGSNVAILGDGVASSTDGIDLSSAITVKADSMLYNNAGTPVDATTPVDGSVGKSGDTVLGDVCLILARFYLETSATVGGILQWDSSWAYSFTA